MERDDTGTQQQVPRRLVGQGFAASVIFVSAILRGRRLPSLASLGAWTMRGIVVPISDSTSPVTSQ